MCNPSLAVSRPSSETLVGIRFWTPRSRLATANGPSQSAPKCIVPNAYRAASRFAPGPAAEVMIFTSVEASSSPEK